MNKLARWTILSILFLLLDWQAGAMAQPQEVRAGWGAFVQPALSPQDYSSPLLRHRAREQAIALLEAAPDKKDALLLETLGYFYLRDFQYLKAQERFAEALKRNSKEPRLRYLLAQTKAILLAADPAKIGENCKEVVEEFRRAAGRDPDNTLPLLQGASVAFDSDRPDLALPLVAEALKRPVFRLYTLPVPEDLATDSAQSAAAWWWAQSELWGEMITRTGNCARGLLKLGDRANLRGEAAQAEELYRQSAQVATLLYRADPPLAAAPAAGLEAEKQALRARLTLASLDRTEQAKIKAGLPRIEATQRRLQQQWALLQDKEQTSPPPSVQARLENQKTLVDAVLSAL